MMPRTGGFVDSNVILLQRVVDQTTQVIENIPSDWYGNPTPCTDWTVRDLVNHITGGATMFAISAEQGSVPGDVAGELMGGDNLGDDPVGAWRVASRRALSAFDEPGVMEKNVALPFGEMPGAVALNIAVFDVATHATDLATASGQAIDDEELLEAALEIGKQVVGPEFRVPGVFDPEQPIGDDAPIADRLAAFAGRKV
jgi:uncharacterized protein (TIGR03086 family)